MWAPRQNRVTCAIKTKIHCLMTKTSGPTSWMSEALSCYFESPRSKGLGKKVMSHTKNMLKKLKYVHIWDCSCSQTDCKWQELLMQTISTSNLDSSQFISQPLLTLTTCSSYLLDTQSAASHVAGAKRLTNLHQGQRSSVSLFWSLYWIIVTCRRIAISESGSILVKVKCIAERFFFSFRDISELVIYTNIKSNLYLSPWHCFSLCIWAECTCCVFYLKQWTAFWKDTMSVPSLSLQDRFIPWADAP